jgi:hypothetical protein
MFSIVVQTELKSSLHIVKNIKGPHILRFYSTVLFDEQVCSNKNDEHELHTHFSFI